MPNSESPTPVLQVEGKSCGRCVKQKRPCDSGRPACSRCIKAGLSSECSYLRDFKPRAANKKPKSESPPLDLEDPTLMPTAQDFDLVVTWFTRNPATAENVTTVIDGTSFILRFACQPAPLRLIVCTLAAFFTKQEESVTLGIYHRAVKAIAKIDLKKPSVHSMQAFILLQTFYVSCLGVGLGKPYFIAALRQMSQLSLHIDADDSPWLHHLNLTDVQKEERRRLFWTMSFLHYQLLSISRDNPTVNLDLSKIKPMSALPGTTFNKMDSVPWVCKILAVMAKIKEFLAEPPLNPFDLIVSPETILLSSELLSLEIPAKCVLTTADNELTPDEYTKFVKQLSEQDARVDATGTISVTFFYNAAICILHHPKILLMGFLPQTTTTYSPEQIAILSLSLDQAITAAVEISNLCEFLLIPTAGPGSRINLDHWLLELFTVASMFQGLTTLWFITCRLPPHWLLGKKHRRNKLVKRAIMTAKLIHRLDSGYRPNGKALEVLQPLVRTSEAMLQEMKKVVGEEQSDKERPSPFSDQENLEDLIVSMKVLQLGEKERMFSSMRQEPWSHLGMMGVELEGGVRWFGRFELEWHEFWNSLSLLV